MLKVSGPKGRSTQVNLGFVDFYVFCANSPGKHFETWLAVTQIQLKVEKLCAFRVFLPIQTHFCFRLAPFSGESVWIGGGLYFLDQSLWSQYTAQDPKIT